MSINRALPWILAVLLGTTSLISYTRVPSKILADELPAITLEKLIPAQIGPWQQDKSGNVLVVNPQALELSNYLYSQDISRIYINEQGQRIMLSIAYGRTQSDNRAVHYPEACYPAQGLAIMHAERSNADIAGRQIQIKKLVAQRGQLSEPITYWATVGEETVLNGSMHKMAQMRYSLQGWIPDGMIIRASSISFDGNLEKEYRLQRDFLDAMVRSLPQGMQNRFVGKMLAPGA